MKTLDGLPVRYYKIDEFDNITGVEMISAVDYPAIEKNWKAFSSKTGAMKMTFADQDRQIVTGPAMIPDLPIYRADADGEYWGVFTSETIEQIVKKFNREKRTVNINYMHMDDSQISSAVIIEQWFIEDPENDKANALGFTGLPKGTWMVSVHFADKAFWDKEVKTGNVRGFSIEGYLNMAMKTTRPNMSTKKFEKVALANGDSIFVDGQIAVDTFVYSAVPQVMLIDGKQSQVMYPIWESVVELADGQILTIAEGKILVIEQKEAVAANKQNTQTNMKKTNMKAEIKTNDGVVLYTSADSFVEGSDVMVDDGSGNMVAAADGDYVLENGATITVASGKITVVAEPAPAADPAAASKMAVTPEDIAAIADALGIPALVARIEALEAANAELSATNTEMAAKFSKIPGFQASATTKSDEPAKKQTFADKVELMKSLKRK